MPVSTPAGGQHGCVAMPRPPDAQALRAIETIYRLLAARGSWPSFADLDRYLDMHGEPDGEAVLTALPPGLAYGVGLPPLRDDQEVALTIAGLSACVDAAEDLDIFLRIIQFAVDLEQGQLPGEPKPELTSSAVTAEVTLPAAGRSDLVRRMGAMLRVEPWGWSSAGHNDEGWSFTVDRRVRRLRGVASVADYWHRTREQHAVGRDDGPDVYQTAPVPSAAAPRGLRPVDQTAPVAIPATALVSWTHQRLDAPGPSGPAAEDVLAFADLLRANGIDAEIDMYHFNEGVDWTRWGPQMVEDRDFVVVVTSAGWKAVWEGRGDPSRNAGSAAEADVLKSLFNRNRHAFVEKVRLVLLPGVDKDTVPSGLDGVTRYNVASLDNDGIEDLVRDLTGQLRYPSPALGPVPHLEPAARMDRERAAAPPTATAAGRGTPPLSPRQAAMVSMASDPPIATSDQWPSTATKDDQLVRLRVLRPEGDQGRIVRCAVDFGSPTVERRLVYTPDPLSASTILSLGVNVDDLEVDFPGQFTDGHLFQPMHRGRYHYSWIASYGRLLEPSTRIVAIGDFHWP